MYMKHICTLQSLEPFLIVPASTDADNTQKIKLHVTEGVFMELLRDWGHVHELHESVLMMHQLVVSFVI